MFSWSECFPRMDKLSVPNPTPLLFSYLSEYLASHQMPDKVGLYCWLQGVTTIHESSAIYRVWGLNLQPDSIVETVIHALHWTAQTHRMPAGLPEEVTHWRCVCVQYPTVHFVCVQYIYLYYTWNVCSEQSLVMFGYWQLCCNVNSCMVGGCIAWNLFILSIVCVYTFFCIFLYSALCPRFG